MTIENKPVSTAAAAKPQAGTVEIGKPTGQCGLCQQAIEPLAKFMAALTETPQGFVRLDCCAKCWEGYDRKQALAFWQAVMPNPQQKKKLFVNDNVLCELFERLADVQEPAKVNFRFVLGLILMRKRLLIYDNTRSQDGKEIWAVHLKGKDQPLDLLDPKLDEQQVHDVSTQLGEILQQEM